MRRTEPTPNSGAVSGCSVQTAASVAVAGAPSRSSLKNSKVIQKGNSKGVRNSKGNSKGVREIQKGNSKGVRFYILPSVGSDTAGNSGESGLEFMGEISGSGSKKGRHRSENPNATGTPAETFRTAEREIRLCFGLPRGAALTLPSMRLHSNTQKILPPPGSCGLKALPGFAWLRIATIPPPPCHASSSPPSPSCCSP